MNIGRIFAHAFARRLAYVVVAALLATLGIGTARAATYPDRGAAYAGCNAASERAAQKALSQGWTNTSANTCAHTAGGGASGYYRCTFRGTQGDVAQNAVLCVNAGEDEYHLYDTVCPAGRTWSQSQNKCILSCPAGSTEDPFNPGTCLDEDKCRARNAGLAGGYTVRPFASKCVAGCVLRAMGPVGSANVKGAQKVYTGLFQYPGEMCGDDPNPTPTPPDKPQECTPVGGGSSQNMCVKPNGDTCVTASTGRQICWKPGETGDKNDGDHRQTRDAGEQPQPRPTQLPNGDTLIQKPGTSPVVINQTTNDGRSITTVVNTYVTTNGTNANGGTGGTGDGESGDGTGGGTGTGVGGGGGTDDEGNSSSGGGNCETPPTSSGDPILAQIATQTWATRCEAEKANKVTVSGTLTNCSAPYTVQGDHPNAHKLRAMRKQVCPLDGEEAPGADSVQGYDGDDPTAAEVVKEGDDEGFLDSFDRSGFGWGASCPAIPSVQVFGTTVQIDADGIFCDFLALGGWFVLLIAGLRSLAILLAA